MRPTGELIAYKRDGLVNGAALAQMRATYAGDLKRRVEPLLVAAFHQELQTGAGDAVLDSLKPSFNAAAASISQVQMRRVVGLLDALTDLSRRPRRSSAYRLAL